MTENKRREPRVETLNLVHVAEFDQRGFSAGMEMGRTLNVSHGGARLELAHALPLRSRVRMTLALGGQLLDTTGTVVHLEVIDDDRVLVGIAFDAMSEQAQQTIHAFLGSEEAR